MSKNAHVILFNQTDLCYNRDISAISVIVGKWYFVEIGKVFRLL